MYAEFTTAALDVMRRSNDEAVKRNHAFIESEDVLRTLIESRGNIAHRILDDLQLDTVGLYQRLADVFAGERVGAPSDEPHAKRIVDAALTEAAEMKHGPVSTGHLLLGIFVMQPTAAAATGQEYRVGAGDVRDCLKKLYAEGKASQLEGKSPKQT